MNLKSRPIRIVVLLTCCLTTVPAVAHKSFLIGLQQAKQEPRVDRITAEKLKEKIASREPVTILDVRSSDGYVSSDNRIKGSIHVNLRRLSFRLSLPPLNNVPRDSEVVTYCACPSDESSIRAAQILLAAGFKHVRVLEGGWQMWLRVNGQIEPRPKA